MKENKDVTILAIEVPVMKLQQRLYGMEGKFFQM